METRTPLDEKLKELFTALPQERAMASLGVRGAGGGVPEAVEIVESIQAAPEVMTALWLYVDELDRSHEISQAIPSSTGSYWHAIMHRREGDFSNSKYWLRRVGSHPVIDSLGYDPYAFVDECEADGGRNEARLVDIQRREWQALFDWCLREAS